MDATQIQTLVTELKAEMQFPSSLPDTVLTVYVKEGEYFLNHLVENEYDPEANTDLDYIEDLESRSLLKTYVKYAYFGALDEFKTRYQGELYESQIKRL